MGRPTGFWGAQGLPLPCQGPHPVLAITVGAHESPTVCTGRFARTAKQSSMSWIGAGTAEGTAEGLHRGCGRVHASPQAAPARVQPDNSTAVRAARLRTRGPLGTFIVTNPSFCSSTWTFTEGTGAQLFEDKWQGTITGASSVPQLGSSSGYLWEDLGKRASTCPQGWLLWQINFV